MKAVKKDYPADDRLYDAVKAVIDDSDFDILKSYVNQGKHKHLVKIINYGTSLSLERFAYRNGVYELEFPKQDLSELMVRIHSDLVGKVWNIYITMKNIISENP